MRKMMKKILAGVTAWAALGAVGALAAPPPAPGSFAGLEVLSY